MVACGYSECYCEITRLHLSEESSGLLSHFGVHLNLSIISKKNVLTTGSLECVVNYLQVLFLSVLFKGNTSKYPVRDITVVSELKVLPACEVQ